MPNDISPLSQPQFLEFSTSIHSTNHSYHHAALSNWDSFGVLRVGTDVTIGNCLLPEPTNKFRRLYPGHKVRAVINNSERIEELALAGTIDFGLIEGVVRSEYVVSEPFLDDRLLFICPPGHAWEGKIIDPTRLSQADFVLREDGSASRKILGGLLRMHGLELDPVWESISTLAIVQAVSGRVRFAGASGGRQPRSEGTGHFSSQGHISATAVFNDTSSPQISDKNGRSLYSPLPDYGQA